MLKSGGKTSFYFMRHAQTDHNVHQIYDDINEVQINPTGIQQALDIQRLLTPLSINTVCSSPLLRVQQTKEIALKNKSFKDIIIPNLKECPSALWRLFLASESRSLTQQEQELVQGFIHQVNQGLLEALQHEAPLLLLAHGGTYWAITHLLQLKGERKIGNCVLVEVFSDEKNEWHSKLIS